jgi:regulatory protein
VSFARKRNISDEATLYEYAVGALSRKMRTVAELKRLLRQKTEIELLVDVVIARLKEQKYLNDHQYAAAYSAFRQSNEKFGKRRVITDLKTKGVHNEVIEKVVGEAYSGVNEEKLAREHLTRKRLRKPETQRESARVFRALMRAGFSSRTIFAILKKWHVPDETLSALEGEEENLSQDD